MLVVDGSGSINSVNFATLIEFVVRVTRQFDISPDCTHMGLIQFSEQSDLEIGLGNITDDGELERAIMNIVYQNGVAKNTGKAIRQATNQLFNSSQARDDVSKVIFLFTDGAPTNPSDAENAGDNARKFCINIIIFGITINPGSVAENNLREITDSNDRVLLVQTFNETQLNNILDELTTQSCPSM